MLEPSPKGLHHIEIYVSDLERSRKFWSWLLDKLGYQLFQEWDAGFSMELGTSYVVFVQREDRYSDITYHRCGTGLNHLAFWADSRNAVDALTQDLRDREVPILYEERHPFAGGPNYYAVFFEDPDRIKVEVVAPHPSEEA